MVCRIFHKSTGLKKVVMPSYAPPSLSSIGAERHRGFVESSTLAPLMDYDVLLSLTPPLPLPRFHCGHLESPRRSVDSSRRRRLECPPPPPVGRHQQGILRPAPSQSLLSSGGVSGPPALAGLLRTAVLILCVLVAACTRSCLVSLSLCLRTCFVFLCVLASCCCT